MHKVEYMCDTRVIFTSKEIGITTFKNRITFYSQYFKITVKF